MSKISLDINTGGDNGSYQNALNDALNRAQSTPQTPFQLKIAQVTNCDPQSKYVELNVITDKSENVVVDYPGFMCDPITGTGIWYGLNKGDIVQCLLDNDNRYKIINKVSNYNTPQQKGNLLDKNISKLLFNNSNANKKNQDLDLTRDTFLIKGVNCKIKLSKEEGVVAGNLGASSINLDTANKNLSQESNNIFKFSNTGYSIESVILRDKRKNIESESLIDPRVNRVWYNNLSVVGLDPTLVISPETKEKVTRNPPLIENRKIIYEFDDSYFVEADELEKYKYDSKVDDKENETSRKLYSRRNRKQDALSLSLVYPNVLIEKIEGTVVDSNGNVLDLNRHIIPVGNEKVAKLKPDYDSFKNVKDLYRKSIAYHFELNARKPDSDLLDGQKEDYANSKKSVYKKNRSRFFFDIDKEGQFKLNVPSSSEVGNVPVLSRYENISTINPIKDDRSNVYNYDYFSKQKEPQDIVLDKFGIGDTISLRGIDDLIPKDRITNTQLKLGTAFHDISTTCASLDDTENRTSILLGPDQVIKDLNSGGFRAVLKNTGTKVVTDVIDISGSAAIAGGRSGTAVFDGMLNISVGANTVDRQSLWLDLQGGVVQRIGADRNGISSITQTDGDIYLQIGGEAKATDEDERFNDGYTVFPNANKVHRLEIRVIQPNEHYSRIVIDGSGILMASDQNIEIRSDQNIMLYAGADVRINSESVLFHKDDALDDTIPLSRQSRDQSIIYTNDASGDGVVLPKPFLGSAQVLG